MQLALQEHVRRARGRSDDDTIEKSKGDTPMLCCRLDEFNKFNSCVVLCIFEKKKYFLCVNVVSFALDNPLRLTLAVSAHHNSVEVHMPYDTQTAGDWKANCWNVSLRTLTR